MSNEKNELTKEEALDWYHKGVNDFVDNYWSKEDGSPVKERFEKRWDERAEEMREVRDELEFLQELYARIEDLCEYEAKTELLDIMDERIEKLED